MKLTLKARHDARMKARFHGYCPPDAHGIVRPRMAKGCGCDRAGYEALRPVVGILSLLR